MEQKKDMLIRTGIFVITLINLGLEVFGLSPLPVEATGIITGVVAVYVYWKNNSWSKAAIQGDVVKDIIKSVDAYKLTEDPEKEV